MVHFSALAFLGAHKFDETLYICYFGLYTHLLALLRVPFFKAIACLA
jgi:hypothetical protein